jgi:hypothetical protein
MKKRKSEPAALGGQTPAKPPSPNQPPSTIRRVAIEAVHQACLVRFLPVRLGEQNLWHFQLAQHCMNEESIVCPKWLSSALGGNLAFDCPVCKIADIVSATDIDEYRTFGSKLQADRTFITYCLVLGASSGRSEILATPESAILNPWEFHLPSNLFLQLREDFLRGVSALRPQSILDLKKGNNYLATRTIERIRLDRQDPTPAVDVRDPNHDAKIGQILNAITPPAIRIPTLMELKIFARKVESITFGDDSNLFG